MASDLKFDIFASQLFGTYWYTAGFLSELKVSSLYPKEYHLDPENADIYEKFHYTAVFVKLLFYFCVFEDELQKLPTPFEPTPLNILDYISRTCRRDGLFRDLTIFEFFMTSCAFVVELCVYCIHNLGYKDIVNYAHLCWTMYFDEYKEEFYRQGGWRQLKIVSVSYVLPNEFLSPYPETIYYSHENRKDFILNVVKAVENYNAFTSPIYTDCKTVAKAWVRCHLKNFNKSDTSNVQDMAKVQDPRDLKVVEKFLLQLRRLCDPNGTTVLNFKAHLMLTDSRKQYSEEISQNALKLNNLTLNDMTAKELSDLKVKQTDIELPLQVNDCRTNKLSTIDLSRGRRNDETNELIEMGLLRNEYTISNTRKSKSSGKNSFLKLNTSSSNGFPRIGTQDTSKQKQNEDAKKERNFERERSEMKCLLRTILVFGNPEGMIHLRSSLPRSDKKNT
ncbi:uncharacterized protein TNIN_52471 [Trichonephila inaurata madagascariensis]|uniref:Uncharacterized protein n=1 Tax=Trichonephila inaurata madagascariensis TaxID=2747483 RepID=A0A8X6IVR0_9ARAC|nr:uncharacterized protein TNIN_52471 [Trichonephila inaurata madagascariensis]